VLRRLVSVPTLALLAVALVVLSPVWVPLAALWDCVRARWRWAHVRLLAFATWWAWLETIGGPGAPVRTSASSGGGRTGWWSASGGPAGSP
jgi:hypothetical protein